MYHTGGTSVGLGSYCGRIALPSSCPLREQKGKQKGTGIRSKYEQEGTPRARRRHQGGTKRASGGQEKGTPRAPGGHQKGNMSHLIP